ncbi:serine hydrolase [Chromatocurvus halotolerans]|nr:serine hydrolase [Chromatocurvus halotolerans]
MKFRMVKTLLALWLLTGLAAGAARAEIAWHWEDKFSNNEQAMLKSWITHTLSALESLVAPLPFDIDIHFYRLADRGEPVPWANTRRGRRQGVNFHVDPAFPRKAFYADWTASHELSHLLIPYLGEADSWFAEGFASYLQYQVMRHMGEMDAAGITGAYRERMARARLSYRLPDIPLAAASRELRRAGAYPTYYWGGAVYFLLADTALRQGSGGGLSNLLRAYVACCRERHTRVAGLVEEFDRIAGEPLFSGLLREFRERPGFPEYGGALEQLEIQLQEKSADIGKDLVALLDRLDRHRRINRISAVGLALVEEGKVVFSGGLGIMDHDGSGPVTGESLFRIGSITKSFTALALVDLARTQDVDLDAPVLDVAGSDLFSNDWAAEAPVTLAQLLEHTAGFTDISKSEFEFNDSDAIPLSSTLTRYRSKHNTAWQPGLFASYSNLGYAFAGRAIEVIAGSDYEDYLQRELFGPLQMNDSGFFLSEHQRRRLVTGYDTDGETHIPYWNMVYRPFGGLNTTVNDMSRFLRMLMQDGELEGVQVFPETVIRRTRQPTTGLVASAGVASGYGAGAYSWMHGGTRFHGHGGDADGYLSRYGYTKRNHSGYFLVVNAFNADVLNAMRRDVESYLTRELPAVAEPEIHYLGQREIEALQGRYLPQTWRFGDGSSGRTLQVLSEGNQLFTVMGNRKRLLIPVSERRFRRRGQSEATSAIIDADGERYFVGPEGGFRRAG